MSLPSTSPKSTYSRPTPTISPSHYPNFSSETSVPTQGNARISIREPSAESSLCRIRNLGARMGPQIHPSHSDTTQSAQAWANSGMPNQEGSLAFNRNNGEKANPSTSAHHMSLLPHHHTPSPSLPATPQRALVLRSRRQTHSRAPAEHG
jgi:hypothetical protein